MKRTNLIMSAVMAMVLAVAIPALAQAQYGPGWMMGYGPYSGLNQDQQAKVQKLNADFYNKTAQMRSQLAAKSYELNSMIYAASPDQKKIQALTKEVSELRAKLLEAQVEFRQQLQKEGVSDYGHMGYGGGMMGGYGMGGYGMGGMMSGW